MTLALISFLHQKAELGERAWNVQAERQEIDCFSEEGKGEPLVLSGRDGA